MRIIQNNRFPITMKKPSLIERLTGMVNHDEEYEDFFEDEQDADLFNRPIPAPREDSGRPQVPPVAPQQWREESILNAPSEGELAVDVYQTPEYVVVKALVAGVLPQNIDISVSREMLTIEGSREDEHEVEGEDYFQHELYWGSFSRTILLPAEVDVDMAEASERHGILIIRLPKINKSKQTKLKVRTK